MPRSIRFVPEEGTLFEVTNRTLQGRLLLVPSPELNEIIFGVLGRAQRLYKVRLCAYVFLSNHFHLLVRVNDAKQLADFMGYFGSNLAREVARLTGWNDKVWARRYQAIAISNEEEAQLQRFAYLISHGVKELLVERVLDWPGVHCAGALLADRPDEGIWFDRTAEYWARQRNESFSARQFATRETVILDPLPCWQHLSKEAIRERVAAIVDKAEADAARAREELAKGVLGAAAVRAQIPTERPTRVKKSPAPLFHAFTRRVHRELYEAYHQFLAAFRDAADRLRSGDRSARFPGGSFPPALPFVSSLAPIPSG